jgi:hypothetical protein
MAHRDPAVRVRPGEDLSGRDEAEHGADDRALKGDEPCFGEHGGADQPLAEAHRAEHADLLAPFADRADHDDTEAGDPDEQPEAEEAPQHGDEPGHGPYTFGAERRERVGVGAVRDAGPKIVTTAPIKAQILRTTAGMAV